MEWNKHVAEITLFVARIETQFGYGTGYIFWQNQELCCIATAKHVINPANIAGWEQAFLVTMPNGSNTRYYPIHRKILSGANDSDSAAILIHKSNLIFPQQCLPIWNFSGEIPIGASVGWLGFPQIINQTILNPSFFSGNISNFFNEYQQYAIDGIAINGVSGGPVFCNSEAGSALVVGTISAYIPNPVRGSKGEEQALPGFSVAHSFSSFKQIIENLNDSGKLDEIIRT
jgi:hypothetical protein